MPNWCKLRSHGGSPNCLLHPMFASLCRHRSNTCLVEFSSNSFKPIDIANCLDRLSIELDVDSRRIVCSSPFLRWDLASSERDRSCCFELIDQRSGMGCQLPSPDPNIVALIAAAYPLIPTQSANWNRWYFMHWVVSSNDLFYEIEQ
jgi:hypothetical protein